MRTRHAQIVTAAFLLIAAASRGERTMFTLYRILIRYRRTRLDHQAGAVDAGLSAHQLL